jgi:hypothetical protein
VISLSDKAGKRLAKLKTYNILYHAVITYCKFAIFQRFVRKELYKERITTTFVCGFQGPISITPSEKPKEKEYRNAK